MKVIDTFMTWITVTVTQVYTYVQTHQITYISYMHFVYILYFNKAGEKCTVKKLKYKIVSKVHCQISLVGQ